jgi:N-acetylmuramoyl-L-alanine amidase
MPRSVVCVDPGHGGKDPGAVAFDGLREKDVVLDISRKLASKLRSFELDVVLTRESDVYVPLLERAYTANEANADLFVSVHTNSVTSRQAHGAEVLVYSVTSSSVPVAEDILSNLTELGLRNRGIKPRPKLIVLKRTDMPAVLVETAFISCNSGVDYKLLRSQDGRDKIADAIARGVLGA